MLLDTLGSLFVAKIGEEDDQRALSVLAFDEAQQLFVLNIVIEWFEGVERLEDSAKVVLSFFGGDECFGLVTKEQKPKVIVKLLCDMTKEKRGFDRGVEFGLVAYTRAHRPSKIEDHEDILAALCLERLCDRELSFGCDLPVDVFVLIIRGVLA